MKHFFNESILFSNISFLHFHIYGEPLEGVNIKAHVNSSLLLILPAIQVSYFKVPVI